MLKNLEHPPDSTAFQHIHLRQPKTIDSPTFHIQQPVSTDSQHFHSQPPDLINFNHQVVHQFHIVQIIPHA